jgi:hypothetical protein
MEAQQRISGDSRKMPIFLLAVWLLQVMMFVLCLPVITNPSEEPLLFYFKLKRYVNQHLPPFWLRTTRLESWNSYWSAHVLFYLGIQNSFPKALKFLLRYLSLLFLQFKLLLWYIDNSCHVYCYFYDIAFWYQ